MPPTIDTRAASTETLKLKATFPNSKYRLWPGQFVTVGVTLTSPEVLTIASSAVQTSQTGQHVFVVKADKTAELREVVVERTYQGDAVVAKGLTEGETVVVDGQFRVIPGKTVDIKEVGGSRAKGGKGGKGGKKASEEAADGEVGKVKGKDKKET